MTPPDTAGEPGLQTARQVKDGRAFLHAIETSLRWLEANAAAIDRLNVFPVPDGDTGTNMVLTLRAALAESAAEDSNDVGAAAAALARGALLGARGNSGVILSQIIRGLAEGLEGLSEFGPREFAQALQRAYQVAYESVSNPVEGTILTVARDAGDAAVRVGASVDTIEELVAEVVGAARTSVDNTPNQLDVLKEAGVVDAGGQGLYVIYDGLLRYLRGEELPAVATEDRAADVFAAFAEAHGADEHGYCTEFIIHGADLSVEKIRAEMGEIGASLLVVGDERMVRVHVHAERPGDALNAAAAHGELDRLKIDNMDRQQAANFAQALEEAGTSVDVPLPQRADACVVAVAAGQGLADVLSSLGAIVIAGGQSMNPRAGDILAAIEQSARHWAIVLPNNSNILMAARQAAEQSPKDVRVVPTRTLPQGVAAMFAFNPTLDADENVRVMQAALGDVATIEITRAVRDAVVGGVTIAEGQYIGLLDDELIAGDGDANALVLRMFEFLTDLTPEVATVYVGHAVPPAQAEELTASVARAYPGLEIETVGGGQELYDYIISVE